jgi:prephenate dehydrogenase
MRIDTLAIVGVGLLGGSVALAARTRGVARRVVGVDRDSDALARACQSGVIDATASLADAAGEANLVVVCTPVGTIASFVLHAAAHCRPGTILTDVGSTKANILAEVEAGTLPDGVHFAGSHPLAGSEKQGSLHSRDDLFTDRLVVVTPARSTPDGVIDHLRAFWSALGSRVEVMDAEQHDRVVALTSHLPHLAASALASLTPENWLDFTGTGFRDTTRIACGGVEVWSSILRANRQAILLALDRLQSRLEDFESALVNNDRKGLEQLLWEGKNVRDKLSP